MPDAQGAEPGFNGLGANKTKVEASVFDSLKPPLGNLEPRLDILSALVSSDVIQNDTEMEYILDNVDPIASLFKYEFGKAKPPPPKRPKGKKKKSKKDVPGEVDLGNMDVFDSSPGFRAPRTRRATAAAAAFEAEAGGESAGPSTLPEMGEQEGVALNISQKNKWKRGTITLPGQSNVPPMVENVDNQQSFKMFDAGWILPPDQKRGGRVRTEKPQPPPKKRIKMGMRGFLCSFMRGTQADLSIDR
jgi:NuA3 HAT complex component NTO1